MTARSIVEAAFLALAALCGLVAAGGMLRSRGTYAALHCANLGNVTVPVFVFFAVIVAKSWSEAAVKAGIYALIGLIGGPIMTHAIARACRLRDEK
jgi:monovalent cation/proton antiporter MnhG/PhaG subunit